jgi:hypothetical protein
VESLLCGRSLSSFEIPSSILFPASHGLGLAFNLLMHFLIERNNVIITNYSGDKKTQLATVGCQEIMDRFKNYLLSVFVFMFKNLVQKNTRLLMICVAV